MRAESALGPAGLVATILESLPIRVFWKDRGSRYLGCNATFASDAGLSDPGEIVGRTDDELGWCEHAARSQADDGRVMESGEPLLAYEEQRTTPAGEQLWLRTSKVPLRDAGGAVVGVLGICEDITGAKLAAERHDRERREAEEALRASEQKCRGIFDESVAAIYVFDRHKRFVDANQAGCDLLGYAREELLGMSIPDVDADPAVVRPAHAQLLGGERLVNFEHRLRRKDGGVVTVLNNSRPLTGADGEVIGLQSTLVDVTEMRAAQQERERLRDQLAATQRMESIGRLAGGVAHDFNNLLAVVLCRTHAALDLIDRAHPARGELQETLEAAERSADLTRQLLAFARRQTASPSHLDLDEKIASLLRMLGPLIGEDVRIVWRPAGRLPAVTMDPSQVDQVLTNLCVNARDAISGAGMIEIETACVTLEPDAAATRDLEPGAHVLLRVRDDGEGMSAEVCAQIFEPFFTTKGLGEGTGLGLATVYGIVRQNHGHVEVESRPGSGTEFRIYLPASPGEAAPTPAPARPASGGSETILLVEDEPAVLRMVQRMLRGLGYTILPAGTPSEALRQLARADGRVDLLLTDVIMPEMRGDQLARRVQERHPAARVLLTSGYPDDAVARHGFVPPGTRLLAKPFELDALARAVREALDEPR